MPDTELIAAAYDSSRKAQAELRERLLPAIREVRRRFAAGQQVGEFKGIEDFYHHIGINPNTVYSWDRRARLLTDDAVLAKSKKAELILPTIDEHGFELDGQTYFGLEIGKGNWIWIMPDAPSMSARKTGNYRHFYYVAVRLKVDANNDIFFSTLVAIPYPRVIEWLAERSIFEGRLKEFKWLQIEPTQRLIKNIFTAAYDFVEHNPQLRRETCDGENLMLATEVSL